MTQQIAHRRLAITALFAVLGAGCSAPDGQGNPSGSLAQPSTCLPSQWDCGTGCVDTQTSVDHCGMCGVACAPGDVCQAGACVDVCGRELGLCEGQCVSLSTTAHCGGCGLACAPGQFCVAGVCGATCDGAVCTTTLGVQCVSTSEDRNHCGGCNIACGAGDICANGVCVLDCGAQTACDRTCVDLQTSVAHCGACNTACAGDKTCVQGMCACPAGLTACGDACVDTMVDAAHCGGCDRACGAQGSCDGGRCVGPDGCTDVPVTGLTLRAVDAHQTVQIPIMEAGAALGTAARNADLVAGRKTLLRIHVAPQAGWMPREVSARVEVTEVDAPLPDQTTLYFASMTPTGPSTDADLSSTFQVTVPAESITPATRYAVSLVECDAPAVAPPAPVEGARFPSAGYQALDARETGPIKVHILPIGAPDVSEAGLRAFKARVEAVFPVTEMQITVLTPLQGSGTSMCSILASISARRSQDNPAPDVYYYGLTEGILGGQSGCSNANVSASSPKVSVGWAQGFRPDDGQTGAATMCHELGHAHGRRHAPCNVQDPDSRYPYPNADIGVWGYDIRTDALYEPTRKDMMSYCPEPRDRAWISDYNYQAILERTIAVNALAEQPLLALSRAVPWRMFVSDSAGQHWIDAPLLVRGTPDGAPHRAVVHGAQGPLQLIEVYVQELEDGVREGAFMLVLPEPDASWQAIEVPGLLDLLPLPGASSR